MLDFYVALLTFGLSSIRLDRYPIHVNNRALLIGICLRPYLVHNNLTEIPRSNDVELLKIEQPGVCILKGQRNTRHRNLYLWWTLSIIAILVALGWMIQDQPAIQIHLQPPNRQHEDPDSFTVLTANVGSSDPRCLPFLLKLCRENVEERIAANIQLLNPAVVAIQETISPNLCEFTFATAVSSLCKNLRGVPQIRRLLGDGYSIVCETRNGFECIGVRKDVGSIRGCELGGLCETERMDIQGEGCRSNMAVMAATVQVKGKVFDIVNAHPESRSAACRLFSIRQIFENQGIPHALVQEPNLLILGDLNLDPWREQDVSTDYWNQRVGLPETHSYYYHSGITEHDPPYPSLRYLIFSRTYDHVVSNFLRGTTVTLGEAPGTSRLDGGSGMDHSAIYGRLFFED